MGTIGKNQHAGKCEFAAQQKAVSLCPIPLSWGQQYMVEWKTVDTKLKVCQHLSKKSHIKSPSYWVSECLNINPTSLKSSGITIWEPWPSHEIPGASWLPLTCVRTAVGKLVNLGVGNEKGWEHPWKLTWLDGKSPCSIGNTGNIFKWSILKLLVYWKWERLLGVYSVQTIRCTFLTSFFGWQTSWPGIHTPWPSILSFLSFQDAAEKQCKISHQAHVFEKCFRQQEILRHQFFGYV